MRGPRGGAILFVLVLLSRSPRAAAFGEGGSPGSAAADSDAVAFTLFDNGSSEGGVDVVLSPSEFRESPEGGDSPPGEAFAIDMSRRIKVSKYKAPEPVVATRAFREDGELITVFEQLRPDPGAGAGAGADAGAGPEGGGVENKRRVYLVADGLEFVWPFVSLGHRQAVSPRVLPPASGEEGGPPVIVESMSETPRVFRVYNICTSDEARAITDNALSLTGDKALKRSTVGEDETTETRTSENAWDSESPTAKVLITRSFQLTNIEETAGKRDGLQLVRYREGQGYNTHPDYFRRERDDDFDFNVYSGGSNRFATVFIYLNDVADDDGGFTVFPGAPPVIPPRDPPQKALDMFAPGTWQRRVTEHCYKSLAVPPELGTAALFYSVTPDGRVDPSSHHAACPLIGGIKWGANVWLWNKQRYGEVRTGDPRTLVISNDADEDVYLTWERKDNGVIPPGGAINMNTFEYHRFKAHFGSYGGEAIDEYTVESEPLEQRWAIKRPRVITMEQAESGGDNEL